MKVSKILFEQFNFCMLFRSIKKYLFNMMNEVTETRQSILTFYFIGRQQVGFEGKISKQIQHYLDEIEKEVIRMELLDFIFKQRFSGIFTVRYGMIFCVIYLLKMKFAAAAFSTAILIGSELTVHVVNDLEKSHVYLLITKTIKNIFSLHETLMYCLFGCKNGLFKMLSK